MKLAVITIRKEPYYRREAIEKGLKRLGYTLANTGQPHGRDDLLITWNLKKGAEERRAGEWERKGGTVLVFENGYLAKQDKTYYAISTHGHNGSGWFPVGDDDRFTPLGFDIKPIRTLMPEGEILVRGQRGIGSELMASPPQWAEKKVAKLKANGRKNVRLIPHPGNFKPKTAVEQDLARASHLYIWASAMGVRALVEGVPVTHDAPAWICMDWTRDGREESLRRMAHGQWHFNEIATGEPFARMAAHNWGPTWR